MNRSKLIEERGITLIALIITIIVLVILAAVAITTAYNTGIIEYAIKGTEDYAQAEKKEKNDLEGLGGFLDEQLQELSAVSKGNQAPEIKELGLVDKTTTSMTISAMATDAEEEELTYTLYFGTEMKEKKENQKSGETVTFSEVTGLENYSEHTYRVVVSDGISESEKSKTDHTYCSGQTKQCTDGKEAVTCNGGTYHSCNGRKDCPYCTGGSNPCPNDSWIVGTSTTITDCPYCNEEDTYWVMTSKCETCGGSGPTTYLCTSCHHEHNTGTGTHNRITCTSCSGNGYTTPCAHNRTSSHSWYDSCSHNLTIGPHTVSNAVSCEHGKTSSHWICDHNSDGEQHD